MRDVIIVGSGPAGYTAAVYAARADLKPLVFEGSITAGGALMNTTDVENFPGFRDGIMGPELMENMRAQAERFGAELVTEDITEMDLTGPIKTVTDGVRQHLRRPHRDPGDGLGATASSASPTRTGCPATASPGVPPVTASSSATRTSPSSAAATPPMEEATFLSRFARSVTIIHRRDELRASKIMAARAENDPKISFAWNSAVAELHGDKSLTGVTLRDTATGERARAARSRACSSPSATTRARSWSAARSTLDAAGYVLTDGKSTRTNLPGVFACGDLVDHTYRQAITAAGTGCSAALDAEHYLADLNDAADTSPPWPTRSPSDRR